MPRSRGGVPRTALQINSIRKDNGVIGRRIYTLMPLSCWRYFSLFSLYAHMNRTFTFTLNQTIHRQCHALTGSVHAILPICIPVIQLSAYPEDDRICVLQALRGISTQDIELPRWKPINTFSFPLIVHIAMFRRRQSAVG